MLVIARVVSPAGIGIGAAEEYVRESIAFIGKGEWKAMHGAILVSGNPVSVLADRLFHLMTSCTGRTIWAFHASGTTATIRAPETGHTYTVINICTAGSTVLRIFRALQAFILRAQGLVKGSRQILALDAFTCPCCFAKFMKAVGARGAWSAIVASFVIVCA